MTLGDLTKCKNLQKRLARNLDTLESLRSASKQKAQVLTGMPHASGISDPVGDFVVEMADLEERIRFLREEIRKTKQDMESFAQTVDDEQLRTIFRLRSIHCMTWGEIAWTIGGHNTSSGVRMMCSRYLKAGEKQDL
jgi:hypothetical protein